jgi:hypothetical protein
MLRESDDYLAKNFNNRLPEVIVEKCHAAELQYLKHINQTMDEYIDEPSSSDVFFDVLSDFRHEGSRLSDDWMDARAYLQDRWGKFEGSLYNYGGYILQLTGREERLPAVVEEQVISELWLAIDVLSDFCEIIAIVLMGSECTRSFHESPVHAELSSSIRLPSPFDHMRGDVGNRRECKARGLRFWYGRFQIPIGLTLASAQTHNAVRKRLRRFRAISFCRTTSSLGPSAQSAEAL